MHGTEQQTLLILDLDETLIHATSCPLQTVPDFTAGPYLVYKRPGLDIFIETVAQNFQLAVWSSAGADHVSEIVSEIIPETCPLQFQWSRQRCTARYHPGFQAHYWVKDLKKVGRAGYDLDRVLIVDDDPIKLERNYGNAVYVSPFEGDPNDAELNLLAIYLTSLAIAENLRTIEKRNWRSQARAFKKGPESPASADERLSPK